VRAAAWLGSSLLLAALAWPASLLAAPVETEARTLLERGRPREAITLLKDQIQRDLQTVTLRWLLARAYLMDRNDFWAQRALTALAELRPDDCDPLLWMSWIHIKHGALDEARERLDAAVCAPGTPSAARRSLLFAMLERHAGNRGPARERLLAARTSGRIYEEDRAVLDQLTSSLDPGYVVPLTGKVEMSAGWASNSRAGSPVDPAARGADESSPTGQLNAWMRLVAPTGQWARPSVEGEARALGYTTVAGRDLSYLLTGARPGVLFGGGAPNALVAYHFDTLLLAGGDRYDGGPLWFYDAHRAEVEVTLVPSLSLFGGGGRRIFREVGRSRTEIDGGVGGAIVLHRQVRLIHALTVRRHAAEKPAYDLWGESAIVSAEVRLPERWSLRAGASAALDWYPHSAGYFQASAPNGKRRDLVIRLSASAFTPPLAGLKAGVTYEYAERFSTADPYDYQDHRVLLKLAFSFSADPWAPRAVSPAGHVPLDHGIASAGFEERLQDLLRQNEADQKRSSCVQ
jgi:hypothetical protein